MTGEVSFFELGVKDPAPAREFCGELFGWKMELGPSGHGFHIDSGNIPGGLHGGDDGSEFTEHSGPGPAGTFPFCRDNQGSSFGLHQPPA